MIYLPFSLSKARQIVDNSLMLIESAQNGEDKITEIDRTWHQFYGMNLVINSCEVELMQKTSKNFDVAEYSELIQIRELIYQHMFQVEDMYEDALAQRSK